MERARNRKHIPLRCQFDLISSNETHRSPGSGLSRSAGLATVFRSSAARLPARASLLSSSKSGAQVPGKVGVTGCAFLPRCERGGAFCTRPVTMHNVQKSAAVRLLVFVIVVAAGITGRSSPGKFCLSSMVALEATFSNPLLKRLGTTTLLMPYTCMRSYATSREHRSDINGSRQGLSCEGTGV
jgi:hypothetical protein